MIQQTERRYGLDSTDRLTEATAPGPEGARAALESFYYALNSRDGAVLSQVWADNPLVQLNNPVGGILHGRQAVDELYARIFRGALRVRVTFSEVVEYLGERHAVFAGRELGSYGDGVPLAIRTTRYLRYDQGRWSQFHHHGSIDDPAALLAYQRAVSG
ncbi:YybH family protein [Kutzneria albida]|uniref:SnoaL-like domain-containing protein n=1 Tax=Kutzneria albida DSM 43870 TaxID=1449976 RepID=W5W8H7_9PSEU|nr:nuclear transport factor 2 family protein [Kutzneria albida]AHH97207.1 hypothetical protein KALB_3843 [Kutzneria albida DSM 43870]